MDPKEPAAREVLLTLTREYRVEPDADDQTARRLVRAAGRIFDALRWARGPGGELVHMPDDLIMKLAFHAARRGCDQFDELAIIKPRGVPDALGQMSGITDWVPIDTPDDPTLPEPITATGEVPDPAEFDDLIPWHTKPTVEGDFT